MKLHSKFDNSNKYSKKNDNKYVSETAVPLTTPVKKSHSRTSLTSLFTSCFILTKHTNISRI